MTTVRSVNNALSVTSDYVKSVNNALSVTTVRSVRNALPVRISCSASSVDIKRGRRWVPCAPGRKPMFTYTILVSLK